MLSTLCAPEPAETGFQHSEPAETGFQHPLCSRDGISAPRAPKDQAGKSRTELQERVDTSKHFDQNRGKSRKTPCEQHGTLPGRGAAQETGWNSSGAAENPQMNLAGPPPPPQAEGTEPCQPRWVISVPPLLPPASPRPCCQRDVIINKVIDYLPQLHWNLQTNWDLLPCYNFIDQSNPAASACCRVKNNNNNKK